MGIADDFAVDVSGTPMFFKIAKGSFNALSCWAFSAMVPPGLTGLDATFQSIGFACSGDLTFSNRVVILFQ